MSTAAAAPVKNLRETRREARATKRGTGAAARALGVVRNIDELEAEGDDAPKAPAKAPAKKAAPKAPKAKAEPKAPAEPKVIEGKKVYVATGRGGKVNRRNFATPMTHAVDVADLNATSEAAKAGLIYRFFPSLEAAEQWAAKKNGEGYNAIVVEAKPYQ